MATDIWGRMGQAAPGLFDFGVGLYGANAGQKEAAERLRRAQGPLFQSQMAGAQTAIDAASGMDPRALGAERFAAEQGLLAGTDAKNMDDLMRMLRAKGMLGVANYNPGVEGITPTGTAMNPHVAAFLAAKNARDAKMAAGSLDAGEAQLDRMLKRSGMLQDQAANTQRAGMTAQGSQPSRSLRNVELLKGAGSILKDAGVFNDVFKQGGLLGQGVDWLKDFTGFGGGFNEFDGLDLWEAF